MTVTIKAAMDMAIRALQEKEQTEEVTQAIHKLQQLAKRDLVAQWSRESILEALENWRKAHDGQAPTVTALAEPGMPGCSIIQKHFGMRASAFLRQQYPGRSHPGTVPTATASPRNRTGWTASGSSLKSTVWTRASAPKPTTYSGTRIPLCGLPSPTMWAPPSGER